MAEGFLDRWSRRKQQARAGEPAGAPPAEAAGGDDVPPPAEAAPAPEPVAPVPAPTLQDVQALTHESDFSAFVARGVAPEVRNAAMKKLFGDPRFNVMDGLDVYVEDYTRPDPLPLAALRQLASAKALGLVEEDPRGHTGAADAVAQSGVCKAIPSQQVLAAAPPQGAHGAGPVSQAADAQDPDMRLQPDHAPRPQGPGDGAA